MAMASDVDSDSMASEVTSDSMASEVASDGMASEVDSDGEASEVDSDGEASEVDSDGEADDGQEIEIKPIRCPEARLVYFSQSRDRLFKKAIKFCARTGAQLAIIVFSPAGKPYSFAHPSVHAVIERYCADPSPSAAAAAADAAPASEATTRPSEILSGFNSECKRLCKAIAEEQRRRDQLDAAARAAGVWTCDDLRGRGMPDLVAMLAALERMQAEVAELEHAHEMFAKEAMVQSYATATGASDAFDYGLIGEGSLKADGGATSSHQGGMDTQTVMLLGGNVNHAAHATLPAFPPTTTMLPPPPPPPQQLSAAFQRLRL